MPLQAHDVASGQHPVAAAIGRGRGAGCQAVGGIVRRRRSHCRRSRIRQYGRARRTGRRAPAWWCRFGDPPDRRAKECDDEKRDHSRLKRDLFYG
ncbi:hypothetical protein FOVG_19000 [Fusarium oxysporum f. sp. pisi HDV247]|uniref:Uncharacterized protein n=1 Tax=Fusarium oxysporum f. sp. pisi HDV247 TaxID=1080344 RepID=W9NNU3_FUSOX|nr:hypothetical protein FOVG_19000 [Fusarium oxysporum f. sp. pisi HDV247]